MNETRQPFTDHVSNGKRGSQNATWLLALMAVALTLVAFWFWNSVKTARHELAAARTELNEATAALARLRTENQQGQDEMQSLQSQLAAMEKERDQVKQTAKSLEDEMRAGLESKDVTISKLQGKLTVNILDRVMFDSGEAVLKPSGEAVIGKIATLLKEHPELKVHVVGHTDNIPIRSEAHGRFLSNWELSTARALAALHFLTDKAGVDPHRVGAVGYGEYRPIADNATAEGRAKNRRIAITILPDELLEMETAAPVKTDVSTHLLPAADK